jgi:glycosyltransferase involved in cell wall biosynthesis
MDMNQMKVVAVVMVRNEDDIIEQTLDHLHCNGIQFVVLDAGSTDKSVEIVSRFAARGLLEHKIVSRNIFTMKDYDYIIEIASRHSPDWILINDADMFYESPSQNERLFDAIAKEGKRGRNIIQFHQIIFSLTEKDVESTEPNIQKKLRYYRWNDDFEYRAWKYYPDTRVAESGSHFPKFPEGVRVKLSRRKFILRHYPFRSIEQANRKIFKERLGRMDQEEHARGLNIHYDQFKPGRESFVANSHTLHKYEDDGKWAIPADHRKAHDAFSIRVPMRTRIIRFVVRTYHQILGD